MEHHKAYRRMGSDLKEIRCNVYCTFVYIIFPLTSKPIRSPETVCILTALFTDFYNASPALRYEHLYTCLPSVHSGDSFPAVCPNMWNKVGR